MIFVLIFRIMTICIEIFWCLVALALCMLVMLHVMQ